MKVLKARDIRIILFSVAATFVCTKVPYMFVSQENITTSEKQTDEVCFIPGIIFATEEEEDCDYDEMDDIDL